jgi:hypothetical protein
MPVGEEESTHGNLDLGAAGVAALATNPESAKAWDWLAGLIRAR